MLFALLLAVQAAPPVETATQDSSAAAAPQTGQAPKLKAINGAFDYPRAALVKGVEGAVYYQMAIRVDGKPANCTVTKSSGSDELDKATCTYAREFMIFDPARNAQGLPVQGAYNGRFVWSVPQKR
ncbi:TonB family protein [Novosphingobium sp. SG751A]|uniref:TonB family protein n=1 Tax=Novosphingobium sp. SG751A TaxID=2587000 RepID=UPI0015545D40|nr:TonB family protein [Novosphingobium sp. SG751A]NOW46892.1 TonB family protein [Novosphingobium sp. SG751A]